MEKYHFRKNNVCSHVINERFSLEYIDSCIIGGNDC